MEKIIITILTLSILLLLVKIKQLSSFIDSHKAIMKSDADLIQIYKEKIEFLEKDKDDYCAFLERAMKSNKDLTDDIIGILDLNDVMLKKMSECKHCNPNNIEIN
jgi:thioredoxin-related protein